MLITPIKVVVGVVVVVVVLTKSHDPPSKSPMLSGKTFAGLGHGLSANLNPPSLRCLGVRRKVLVCQGESLQTTFNFSCLAFGVSGWKHWGFAIPLKTLRVRKAHLPSSQTKSVQSRVPFHTQPETAEAQNPAQSTLRPQIS